MWSSPVVVQILCSMGPCLAELLVVFCSLRGLAENLAGGAGLRSILIWGASDLLSRPYKIPIDIRLQIVARQTYHRQWSQRYRTQARRLTIKTRSVAVDDLAVGKSSHGGLTCLRCCCLPRFRSSRSLLTSSILLGEALLDRLGLPVVVANTSSIVNQPTAELPKHTTCRDDGYLS